MILTVVIFSHPPHAHQKQLHVFDTRKYFRRVCNDGRAFDECDCLSESNRAGLPIWDTAQNLLGEWCVINFSEKNFMVILSGEGGRIPCTQTHPWWYVAPTHATTKKNRRPPTPPGQKKLEVSPPAHWKFFMFVSKLWSGVCVVCQRVHTCSIKRIVCLSRSRRATPRFRFG